MLKAIFFDNDGVLSDIGFKTDVVREYAKEYGLAEEEFYTAIHDFPSWKQFSLGQITEAEYLADCATHLPVGKFNGERYNQLLDQYTFANLPMIKFIKEELAGKYILGVISNCPREWFDRLLTRTGLLDILTVKLVSGYVHIRKPAKEIFALALQEAGVKPEECIYVDDRPERIDGAVELGIGVVVYNGDIQDLKNKIKQYD